MEVKVQLPERKALKFWVLNLDGSATPLITVLNEKEMNRRDLDDFHDAAYPSFRTNQKAKANHTIYKSRVK